VPKEAIFTMKLEPELRDQFMAAAEAMHRPASQVVRELMREFIQHQRDARDYDEFLRSKVQAAQAQRKAGQHFANEDVEAEFAALRTNLIQESHESGE
jgi:predicted transcriptional regulator